MTRLAVFVWHFVVGDDWRVAVVVVAALGATVGLVHAHVSAWWVLPAAVFGVLSASVWRAARSR